MTSCIWLIPVIAIITACTAFCIYYFILCYPRKKSVADSDSATEHLVPPRDDDIPELEMPQNWLELEMLGLSERRIREEVTAELSVDPPAASHNPRLNEAASSFHKPLPLRLCDLIPIIVISAVYAAVAFTGLASSDTPQSFAIIDKDDSVVVELPNGSIPDKMLYYTGIGTGHYSLYTSYDGLSWNYIEDIEQKYSELMKWQTYNFPDDFNDSVRFIKLESKNPQLLLGEIAVYDSYNRRMATFASDDISRKLIDEIERPVVSSNFLYNSYFDEIYHARTAYEHILNFYPYEISHPPLGKLTISTGIQLFGMNPFGWRFSGVIFGILMLPLIYLFIFNLFGKMLVASCATLLFAFDFMHFVQTRIATIDTYGVFFILLMFYFMYRYFTQDFSLKFSKTILPLALSGIAFGIGAASKWTVMYGAAGLFIIFVLRQILRLRYDIKCGNIRRFWPYFIKTFFAALLFFICIPALIYLISYIPYGTAKGMSISEGMLWDTRFLVDIVWDNQKFMFNYHKDLVATHPYGSNWWQWILNLRPILYYLENFNDGTKSAFAAFGNPVVWWTGIGAIIAMFVAFIRKKDLIPLFILIGYFAQLIPWILIQRVAFIYHYFPNVLFIVLAIAYMFNDICNSKKNQKSLLIPAYTTLALLLFVAFYPVLTGIRFNTYYTTTFLRWFDGMYPF